MMKLRRIISDWLEHRKWFCKGICVDCAQHTKVFKPSVTVMNAAGRCESCAGWTPTFINEVK